MLNAFIDDSGTHGGALVCVLAGFMSTSDQWKCFSEDWEAACRRDPPTPDFHMSEAWNIRGAFWGYHNDQTIPIQELLARRDGRVQELIGIIKKHAIVGMRAQLELATYREIFAGNVPKHVDSPYFVLFWHLQFAFAKWCLENEYHDATVQFIFDDQSSLRTAAAAWHEAVVRGVPPEAAKILAAPPQFAHDKDTPPLKAADIAAWVFHRIATEGKQAAKESRAYTPITPAMQLSTMRAFAADVDADAMRALVPVLKRA